jgi:diaminohydroxyphosphoribosylaminopyrimidine deaminase/5-amino-6-(5-phosphoribosylamino)uracil reductase
MDDEYWMKRALRLAEKGRGRTSPNPMVGAVLVKAGKVVGEGYHAKAGEPHAEILALRQAGRSARGATLYINLEPCTHYGRTPPCAPRVVEAGIKKAVIGMEDPNPLVRGKGIRSLKNAGIEVLEGILGEECRTLNEAFCHYIVEKRPFVILKVAATLDGKIAARSGESKWVSGESSRRLVHRLRDRVDGILIGVGTLLRDDPLLTARVKGARDPFRIILDSRLRIPEGARVVRNLPERTIIASTRAAPGKKVERLEKKGVRVLIVDSKAGRVDLRSCLRRLGEIGLVTLMVEGGSRVNGAFLDERLFDKFLLFLSPRLIGDPHAIGMFDGKGFKHLKDATPLERLKTRRIGQDILIEGYPAKTIID